LDTDEALQEAKHLWYTECVERACREPTGSFLYTFWWSLRTELYQKSTIRQWANNPAEAFKEWLLYLEFKWDQLEPHRKANGCEEG
jgi:hypothetical protein